MDQRLTDSVQCSLVMEKLLITTTPSSVVPSLHEAAVDCNLPGQSVEDSWLTVTVFNLLAVLRLSFHKLPGFES